MSNDLFDLTGQVALVTGGASGLGKAIAAGFVQSGAKVLVGSRTPEKTEQAAKELNQILEPADGEDPAAGVPIDVTKDASVERAVRKAIELFGRLDILVNSAGILLKKPTFDLTAEELINVYDTHVAGSLRCAQAAGRLFREQHSGCIINLASVTTFVDLTEVTAYACAKSAVQGLTQSLANEWAKYGIRTNAIAPGFFPEAQNKKLIEGTDRGRRILEGTPMGRFGESPEIAGAAVYLASKAGSFVNGEIIKVDGGFLACGVGDTFAPWAKPEE